MADEQTSEGRFWVRWDRLVQHVLDGSVVPFLGGGVSMGARAVAKPSVIPTAKEMCRRLAEALHARVPAEARSTVLTELGLPECFNRTLSECSGDGCKACFLHQAEQADMTRLAEVLNWYAGPQAAARVSGIVDFRLLVPLPAHRAIARLAREGLIDEVITTNYDCCFERAWRNTLPVHDRLNDRKPADQKTKGWHPAVIRTRDELGERGARRECPRRYSVVRLYKINGCAERYASCNLSTHAEMILTEPQLRGFGARAWARDVLRDRARSAHLLFSGFGSDEPQVRFTMLDLMQEPARGTNVARPLWDSGNAPWVQAHDANLSYPQAQLLRAFQLAHPATMEPDTLDVNDVNVVHGGDRGWLSPSLTATEEPKLPGDLFWTRLFQSVWGRLLERHTSRESLVHAWLGGLGVAPQRWLGALRAWWFKKEQRVRDGWTERFGNQAHLVEDPGLRDACSPPHDAPACPPLWRWLAAVNGVDIATPHPAGSGTPCPAEQDYYVSFREDPLQIVLVLLLVRNLVGDTNAIVAGPRSGLRLPVAAGTWLIVRAEHADPPEPLDGCRGAIVVTLPRRSGRAETGSVLVRARDSPGVLPVRAAVRQEPLEISTLLRVLDPDPVGDAVWSRLRQIVADERVDHRRAVLVPLGSTT